jgi:hypothetical protein
MNREMARRLLENLRRGNKAWLKEYFLSMAQALRVGCEHCGNQAQPLMLSHDFHALTVSFDCSLCGKRNVIPLKNFPATDPTATD